jgi:hypothetical protein
MSHIVTIQAKIKDPVALAAACVQLGVAVPTQGTAQLYSGQASGLVVQLPGWTYPAVIDTASGTIAYDNFNEAWGEQKELDKLLQSYAIEKARIEARKAGQSILREEILADGSIKLTISAGGVA